MPIIKSKINLDIVFLQNEIGSKNSTEIIKWQIPITGCINVDNSNNKNDSLFSFLSSNETRL